ncbi:hypothetical protein MASR2M64_17310 [Candidatus Cloacimonadota bacterium]
MKHAKLLIVDDEKNILAALEKAFDGYEYLIDLADNGKKACELISQTVYDCILLDMRLPDISGMEILERCKPQNVIIITAHGTIENAVGAMKLGCVDYLRKPFDLDNVRQIVEQVLSRRDVAFTNQLEYEATIERAKLQIQNRKFSSAIETIHQALQMSPDNAGAYTILGVLYEVMNDLPKAVAAYHTAIKLDPANEPARDNLSRLRNLETNTSMKLGY